MSNSAGPKITKDGLVLDFDAANIKSYNFYADPYSSSVSLYLQMNGANGSTTFTDSSPNALTVTANGNAQISTTQSKYNGTSAYFDGAGDYLSFPTNSNFDFGSGDFTVEFWYYYNGLPQAAARLFQTRNGDLYAGLSITHKFTNRGVDLTFGASLNGSTWTYNNNEAGSFSVTANAWTHVAVVRSGTVLYCYINGVQNTIFSSFTGSLYYNASDVCVIGGQVGTSRSINGYIDDLKITKGIAKYTASFTSPPIPSTCTDLTRSKNVGTLTGGVDYNFSNGGSLVFDGTNDYVLVPSSDNFAYSTGDFTLEVWFNSSSWAAGNNYLLDHGTTTGGSIQYYIGIMRYYNSSIGTGSVLYTTGFGSNISINTWHHIVVSRQSNTTKLYLDGVLGSSATDNYNFTANRLVIGAAGSLGAPFNGKIPQARIYKGKGLTSTEVYNNFAANRGRFGI